MGENPGDGFPRITPIMWNGRYGGGADALVRHEMWGEGTRLQEEDLFAANHADGSGWDLPRAE